MIELDSDGQARGSGGGRRRNLPRPQSRQRAALSNHSSFVGAMKIVLPAIAIAIVILVIAWPQFRNHEEGFHIGIANISPEDVQNLRMIKPRYQGTDRRGEPFTVTANSATKTSPTSDVVTLEHPMADITITSGNWIALRANYGVYREQDQQLDLIGSVNLFHDDGYEFDTLAAHVNLANNTADGDDPVHGQGPFGDIRSEGFRILDKGERVLFTGKAHLLLRPRAEAGSGASAFLPSAGATQAPATPAETAAAFTEILPVPKPEPPEQAEVREAFPLVLPVATPEHVKPVRPRR